MRNSLRKFFLGHAATHCSFCGAEVPASSGFRLLPIEVYCCEDHALEHRRWFPSVDTQPVALAISGP